MEYKISKLGNIVKIVDNHINLLSQDESTQEYKEYINYLENEGVVEHADILSEEEIQEIKEEEIQQLKKLQYEELKLTDWYYIRRIDTGEEVPLEVEESRNLIRLKYNSLIEKL